MSWVSDLFGNIKDEMSSAWNTVKHFGSSVANEAADKVLSLFQTLVVGLYKLLIHFIFSLYDMTIDIANSFLSFCQSHFGGGLSMNWIYYLVGLPLLIFVIKNVWSLIKSVRG